MLIEKEWIAFGHRFGDRCAHHPESGSNNVSNNSPTTGGSFLSVFGKSNSNNNSNNNNSTNNNNGKLDTNTTNTTKRSPVFILFLDCVFQLLCQHVTSFEFNENLLISIVNALYSCQYGTFLCNSEKERKMYDIPARTISLWTHVLKQENRPQFFNPLYIGSGGGVGQNSHLTLASNNQSSNSSVNGNSSVSSTPNSVSNSNKRFLDVLWRVRDIVFWKNFYCAEWILQRPKNNQTNSSSSNVNVPMINDSFVAMQSLASKWQAKDQEIARLSYQLELSKQELVSRKGSIQSVPSILTTTTPELIDPTNVSLTSSTRSLSTSQSNLLVPQPPNQDDASSRSTTPSPFTTPVLNAAVGANKKNANTALRRSISLPTDLLTTTSLDEKIKSIGDDEEIHTTSQSPTVSLTANENNKAVQKTLSDHNGDVAGASISSKEAPKWMPDESANNCGNCSVTFNSLTKRKHHCRAVSFCLRILILIFDFDCILIIIISVEKFFVPDVQRIVFHCLNLECLILFAFAIVSLLLLF